VEERVAEYQLMCDLLLPAEKEVNQGHEVLMNAVEWVKTITGIPSIQFHL